VAQHSFGQRIGAEFIPAQGADEMSAEVIAAQIRDQGYACDKALSAEREHSELRLDSKV
jgi:hypothetical protein